MKKRLLKRVAACVMAMAMAFGMAGITGTTASTEVQAASKKKVKSIKFKKKGYVLSKKGKKVNLSKQLTFNPKKPNSKKVTYKSSSKKIATVSSKGVVTAKKKGTVTITATSRSNKKAKATTKVTVGKTVSKLKFKEGTRRTLKTTYRFTLHPTYSPKSASTRSVTYKSSNTRVATVTSKGVVTARAAGRATITATCKDAKAKTAKMTVTVPAFVTGVSVNPRSATLIKGDTANITATTSGSSSGVTYRWSSSNSNVASISGSGRTITINARNAGTATIRVEAYNGNNTSSNHKTATCTISVKASQDIQQGGNYKINDKDVVIANRTTGTVNITAGSKIKTLTLQPGNYAVNLTDTTVDKVVTTASTTISGKTKAANNVPTISINGNTTIQNIIISQPLEVAVQSSAATITAVQMNTPAAITAVLDAKPITTLNVNTTEDVKVEAPVTTLNLNSQAQVTVASVTSNINVNSNAKVNLQSEVGNLTVNQPSTINVTSTARVDKVAVDVKETTSDKVEINTKDGATVGKVEVFEGNTAGAAITGEGTVSTVKVPENQQEQVDVETAGTEIINESDEPVDTTPKFVKATKTTSSNLTTFSDIDANSAKFKISKGEKHVTYVTKAQFENVLSYLSNPEKAYTQWMNRDTFTEYSGVVSVSGSGKTKTVTVSGTANYDGTYTVTIDEVTKGTAYTVVVVDKDQKSHTINVTVDADGKVTADSKKYTATIDKDGTDFAMIRKEDSQIMAKVKKENDKYSVSLLASKAGDITIEYLEIKSDQN